MQHVQTALENLMHAEQVESDPQDKHTISKVRAVLHGLIASRQKERDAAMGIGPKEKAVRRAHGAY